ncbi:UDP-N-acetylmuramate--L-alanine ligase [Nitrosomonas cryotolerans]|uniref:UDP-N-acetylmuramate--L-alanine ligase n=1 Tax=Nitrosomonas cryotolerans ATCC 49181 TaxID=1131553 RepID=A0A1N6IQP2_9PROT|nr:UDP-N-acetylmuramate--L-alanine ligase [Nitrosomonas cryotolerans]SFP34372.1 UDP-N-acetylmuramate--L-alanine ligase [Nitrosomonas cryotolerans]SIO34341.1 UDP-N-acetylmuramate--L-alanine ligase [Nitrosomonas cryotolerans ATCC 49181]
MIKHLPDSIHLIGIGGSGMSGIAHCLLDMGHTVSGSDLKPTETTKKLSERGAVINYAHNAENIHNAKLVIVSEAIPGNNVEMTEARRRHIDIMKRAAFINILATGKTAICVAGTHGKSTTSAMIAKVLQSAAANPSYIVGADTLTLNETSACMSTGQHMIIESCEAFQGLSHYSPSIAVITNIDDDHIEHYGGQKQLDHAFQEFANRTAADGYVIINGDDAGITRIKPRIRQASVTFGSSSDNDISAVDIIFTPTETSFHVIDNRRRVGIIKIPIPGQHIVTNALGCIAACFSLGISFDDIARGLCDFTGVNRRWDDYGVINGVHIIDDYAHHPTELRAAIKTARLLLSDNQRLILAFQPQLYSRTRRLRTAFAEVIADCNGALLLDIDPGGEESSHTINSQIILDQIDDASGNFLFFKNMDDLVAGAAVFLKADDVLLIAGSGEIAGFARLLIKRLGMGSYGYTDCLRMLTSSNPANDHSVTTVTMQPSNVVSMIKTSIKCFPDSIAVFCDGVTLSYTELDHVSDILAQKFIAYGMQKGHVLGIGLPPSLDQISCLIAALKIGVAYLPMDEKLPEDRLRYMAKSATVDLLVTAYGSKIDKIMAQTNKMYLASRLNTMKSPMAERYSRNGLLPINFNKENIAYICFTSGSTGTPKGIPITHAAISSFIHDALGLFYFTHDSRTVLNSSMNFDVSIAEILVTLCAGGTIIIPKTRGTLLGRHLDVFIKNHAITHLLATPSVLATLSTPTPKSLETIIAAGEACPQTLADKLSTNCHFFNSYGPAEATIYSTTWQHSPGKPICIGSAMSHIDIHILDPQNKIAAAGEVGELCLSGIGVFPGYLCEPGLYRNSFIFTEGHDGKTIRLYRTGDLVRRRGDGQIEFIGRLDNQIKIRGNRIELEEIEASIQQLPGVCDATVCAEHINHDREIIAYFTAVNGAAIKVDEFSQQLSSWLPEYMIPSQYIQIEAFSLTSTGKKNRTEVSDRNRHKISRHAVFIPPVTDTQIRLGKLWKSVLRINEKIGLEDDFGHLGGDSLNSVILIAEVEEIFNICISPAFFGRITTLGNMANQLDGLIGSGMPSIQNTLGFESSEIFMKLRRFTASWAGEKLDEDSLIISLGPVDAKYNLFWCLQSEYELKQLAKHLGSDYRVHGMRSGHLAMDYNENNLNALVTYYSNALTRLYPEGSILLGGNCQGGQIAHAIALRQKNQNRHVSLLILMESARLPAYEDSIAFIYGKHSYLNPYTRYQDELKVYNEAYSLGYALDIILGEHGTFFKEPNIHFLASRINTNVINATGKSTLNSTVKMI